MSNEARTPRDADNPRGFVGREAAGYTALRLPDGPFEPDPDTLRLQAALRRQGFDAALEAIETAYERYSDEEWAATWMWLPDGRDAEDAAARKLVEGKYLVAV